MIIATGSSPNKLGLKDEDKFWSKGISSCAVCDGALYKKKNIVVVGGGDSACEEALFLTKFSDVLLIHRGDSFPRASKIMVRRVLENPKIKIMYNTTIKELRGELELRSIVLGTGEELKVDGLFYGLGLKPNVKIFKGIMKDADGYIKRGVFDEYSTEINMPGIFVCGDTHDKEYRQAIVAAGDGCKAALEAIKYLQK